METQDKYIGNAYLEAKILERFYIISGTEFSDREFHVLILPRH